MVGKQDLHHITQSAPDLQILDQGAQKEAEAENIFGRGEA